MSLLDRFLEQGKQKKWVNKIRQPKVRALELGRLNPKAYELKALEIFAQVFIAKGHLGYGEKAVGEQIRHELGDVENQMLRLCKLDKVDQLENALIPMLKRLKEPIHWVDLWQILERWNSPNKSGSKRLYTSYKGYVSEPPVREVEDDEDEDTHTALPGELS